MHVVWTMILPCMVGIWTNISTERLIQVQWSIRFSDAAITGQLRLVKMLVERGADPCFKNRKGKTPCDVAAAAVHNFLITARGEFHESLMYAMLHALNYCMEI